MTRTQIKQLSRRTTSRVRREERGSGRPGPGCELKPCPGETSHRQRPQTRRSQREEPEEHPRPRQGALNPTIPNPPQGSECEAPWNPQTALLQGWAHSERQIKTHQRAEFSSRHAWKAPAADNAARAVRTPSIQPAQCHCRPRPPHPPTPEASEQHTSLLCSGAGLPGPSL